MLLDKDAPGGTILPLLISTDKTQVTTFRNKSTYPVYLTLGNIPKEIRRKPSCRAYVLLGYLPTTTLEHITNESKRRRCLTNLFHRAMDLITAPLQTAGTDGMVVSTGEGVRYRGHPILACYICDYPEQVLVTCCKSGECPKCTIPREGIGEGSHDHGFRDLKAILDALSLIDDIPTFREACKAAGIKPVFQPFWEKLPYSNIFHSITSDILHQLYQGILKHLKQWILQAYGPVEIDARCRRLPPNHNIRIFMKGISTLSRVTGQEHNQISRFLLGLIVDLRLPNGMDSGRLVSCLRSFLDFLYLAQYPAHSDETLGLMESALEDFHTNKSIFSDLEIREHFRLPKLEGLNHFIDSIRQFGSLDNCNTEYTERLHIDLTKDAYRATNHKDEYPQMTLWLDRKEKMLRHEKFIDWRLTGCPSSIPPLPSLQLSERQLHMTKKPSAVVKLADLPVQYGVPFFTAALTRFAAQYRDSSLSVGRALEDAAYKVNFSISKISVYHRIKFLRHDPIKDEFHTVDSIHIQPARSDKRGDSVPARFDPALIKNTPDDPKCLRGILCATLLVFMLLTGC
jgi:hypothetical protein